MDKNLQNIDDLFNRAYQQYEDEPSAAAWDKLSAALDKDDAVKYKRRFIGWKRIAVVLLFLLAGFMIYETGAIINRKNEKKLSTKENVTDTTFVRGNMAANKKQSTVETKKHLLEINKTALEYTGTPPPFEVLTQTDKKMIVAPNTIQKNKNVHAPTKSFLAESKNNKLSEKTAKDVRKNTILNGVTPADENRTLVNNKLLKEKLSPNYRNEKNINTATGVENKYVRKLLPSREIAVAGMEKAKPLPANLVMKEPAWAPTNTTATIAQLKKKKLSAAFKPFWSVTAFAGNDWSQNKLDKDVSGNSGNPDDEKEEINGREKHERSFSAGLLATRQLSKHIGFKTGILYSNTLIAIAPHEMYATKKNDGTIAYKFLTSSGYGFVKPGFGMPPALGDSIRSSAAQHELQILSVPLMASFRIDKNKFSILPAVGLSANFITRARVNTEVMDALNKEAVTITGLDGMKSFYTGLIADVSLQYNYNSKWSISILPGFKYALTPITKGNVVKTYPYSFNIGAGITYKL